MSDILAFQYCQKMVVFNKSKDAVLLARRKGEVDYDGIYSFVGGKMEITDGGFIAGLEREKNEEIGKSVRLRVCPSLSYNAYFVKKDGSAMVLPHYFAIYDGGDIILNEEYADYKWVLLDQLSSFEPKIETIETAVEWVKRIDSITDITDFVSI